MTERPILMSGPMVRAAMSEVDPKTQTRRVVKPQPVGNPPFHIRGDGALCDTSGYACGMVGVKGCPYGVPGDRLWVRETTIISPKRWNDGLGCTHTDSDGDRRIVQYLATHPDRDAANDYKLKATPSIFMPRWACRLTLEVTAVRVERLQEISEADAIAEGLRTAEGDGLGPGPGYKWYGTGYHGAGFAKFGEPTFHTPRHPPNNSGRCSCTVGGPSPAQCAYRELWDSLNAKSGFGWAVNPWVWVVGFKRL